MFCRETAAPPPHVPPPDPKQALGGDVVQYTSFTWYTNFTLLVTESSGAFSSTLTRALRAIGTQARLKSSTDYTAYGTARHSPRTFYSHHAAAISAAIVAADALTILEAAAHASYLLSIGRLP